MKVKTTRFARIAVPAELLFSLEIKEGEDDDSVLKRAEELLKTCMDDEDGFTIGEWIGNVDAADGTLDEITLSNVRIYRLQENGPKDTDTEPGQMAIVDEYEVETEYQAGEEEGR